MNIHHLSNVKEAQQQSGRLYTEFIKNPSLSVGLYVLPAGGIDPQQPHTEDEVYYIVAGRGSIRVGDEDQPVQAGSVILVEAGVEHKFHTILEDLEILVFFAPAEYSLARSGR